MKQILNKLIYIIIFLACIWGSFQIGSWWTGRLIKIPDLQPIPHIPQFKPEKAKSWIWKITHTLPKTREGERTITPEWMTQVWTFPSVIYRDDVLKFQVVRADTTYPVIAENIPPDYELHGTPTGYVLFYPRIRNPIHWQGIKIGAVYNITLNSITQFSEITPYIETGISVWRCELVAGADKDKCYIKTGVRLW